MNQFWRYSPIIFGIVCLLAGCKQQVHPVVRPAFYHWKTTFDPAPEARQLVQNMETERIYLHLFDIDWDEGLKAPAPIAYLEPRQPLDVFKVEWVPTVFITNRSLTRLPIQSAADFAERLTGKVLEQIEALKLQRVPEVQLDCDWTQSTRDVYFEILKTCRAELSKAGINLSATIRLHQLRYPEQTGVPPADRGMLMYYNMGEVRHWEEPNSILNLAAAAPYLQTKSYALPLDLALPVFQWGVLFREGEMIRLLSGLSANDLSDPERFYDMKGGRYEVVQGTFLQGHYLYEGDLIRLETVNQEALHIAVDQLRGFDWAGDVFLTFYELDSAPELGLDAAALDAVIKAFEGE
jgi:hypothetical protein